MNHHKDSQGGLRSTPPQCGGVWSTRQLCPPGQDRDKARWAWYTAHQTPGDWSPHPGVFLFLSPAPPQMETRARGTVVGKGLSSQDSWRECCQVPGPEWESGEDEGGERERVGKLVELTSQTWSLPLHPNRRRCGSRKIRVQTKSDCATLGASPMPAMGVSGVQGWQSLL